MVARILTSLVAMACLAAPAGAQGTAVPPSAGAGPVVVVETEKGTFEFETYPNEAPKSVAHVIGLVNRRFYNGLRFHRVVKDFVVQAGDPLTRDMTRQADWGRGNSGTPVGVGEFSKLRTHVKGAVALAHAGDAGKADSQFYVCLNDTHRLDGYYTVFGKVISGMDVVGRIAATDRIIRATVRGAR